MATLVCLHAHPDDECIQTGGTIARASAEGHRVVLVVATGGEHGETPADLGEETLAQRRRRETEASADALGIARIVWLGWEDSGMTGWEQNGNARAFCNADLDEAATRLADVLREERADVLTTYDWHGGYGHPDHVKVHEVGHAAAAKVPSVRVLEGTMNRDHIRRGLATAREAGLLPPDDDWDVDGPADDGNPMGSTEDEITLAVDVASFAARKRAAMRCHASQLTDTSFFLSMDDERFATAFGSEWFIEPGRPGPMRWGWIFE